MSLTFTQQPSSSVMSIGAITSPCSNNNSQQSRKSSIDSTHSKPAEYQLPSLSQQVGYTLSDWSPNHAAVGHWIKSSNRETGNIDMMHRYNHTQRMRYASEGTTIASSPSFSTSSDHESDSNSSCSQPSPICKASYPTATTDHTWLNSVYNDSSSSNHHNKNNYTKEVLASENLLNSFDMEEYEESGLRHRSLSFDYCDTGSHQGNNHYIYSSDKSITNGSNGRKGDALATRRARNKLASAKYRAKKQALTHAMQSRIMQLATQVMTLCNELSQTRKNETEILGRYERLVKFYQRNNNGKSIDITNEGNAASITLF